MKKLIQTALVGSIAVASMCATPALAHDDYYGGRDYRGSYNDGGYDSRSYDDRGYDDRGYDGRGYDGRGYDRRYSSNRNYRGYQNCRRHSGGTGTILGAIAGGLLGREIGRGGWGNRPSTTGLILGAGAGALAGREIDKSSSCNR